ncbi:MAG: hypothetical protein JNJ45_07300 [Chthonomonas sp.]|nr:hypothetical protein [Chthonomonas sp.]
MKFISKVVLAVSALVGSVAHAQTSETDAGWGYSAQGPSGTYSTNLPVREGISIGGFIPNKIKPKLKYTDPPANIPPVNVLDENPFGTESPPSAFRSFIGITATGWRPPDPEVAAGPSNLVAVTNSHFAIFEKDGTNGYQSSFSGFMNSDYFLFDPKIGYDPFNDRFLILMLANKYDASNNVTESHYVLMYSDDSNAYGNWSWRFLNAKYDGGTFDNNHWVDFPHLGFASGGIMVAGIKFPTFTGSGTYSHTRLLRSSEVYGAGGTYWYDYTNFQSDGSADFRPVPARQLTDPGAFYMVSGKEGGSTNLTVRRFTNYTFGGTGAPTAPTVTSTLVNVGGYTPNGLAYQQGAATKLEVNDGRILSVSYANGKLFSVNGSAYNYGDGAGNRSTVRAYCMDIYNSYNLLINDTIGNSGLDYYYPAIACNPYGDAIITFGRSGQSEYASSRYSGYKSGDTSFGFSVQTRAGAAGYVSLVNGRNRWGDYFGGTYDPWDNRSFWIIGQYAVGSTTWGTWIQEANYKPNKLVAVANANAPITGVATLSATVTSSAGGAVSGETVNFYISNAFVGSGTTNGSGIATYNYTVPFGTPSTFTIRADTPVTTVYNAGSSTATLTTTKANTLIQGYNTYPTAGTTVALYARVSRTTDNAWVNTGAVWFYVNGSYAGSATPGNDGYATLNYAVPTGYQGPYDLDVYYISNINYNSSSNFDATLYAYQPTITNAWDVAARRTESVYLWSQYLQSNGSPLAGGTVYYYMDGSYLGTATTDSSGYAYWYYTIPAAATVGNHTWEVYSYPASGYWVSGYRAATLTVKPASFTGYITYGGLASWAASGGTYSTRVRIRNSSGVLIQSSTVNASYGTWEVPFSGATGTYRVSVKPAFWLSEYETSVSFNAATYGSNTLYTSHRSGDCNGDDIVDIADYAILAGAFDKIQGQPGYALGADLNGDQIVDIADYTQLALNFDAIGEDYP